MMLADEARTFDEVVAPANAEKAENALANLFYWEAVLSSFA